MDKGVCLLQLISQLLDLSLHHLFGRGGKELSVLNFIHPLFQVEHLGAQLLLDIGGHVHLGFEHHCFVLQL